MLAILSLLYFLKKPYFNAELKGSCLLRFLNLSTWYYCNMACLDFL